MTTHQISVSRPAVPGVEERVVAIDKAHRKICGPKKKWPKAAQRYKLQQAVEAGYDAAIELVCGSSGK